METIVYQSKLAAIHRIAAYIVTAPRRGRPGWRMGPLGMPECVLHCSIMRDRWVPDWQCGWIPVDRYRTQQAMLAMHAREYRERQKNGHAPSFTD